MSKNRFINTKFWNDSFVTELDPLERYLFLYFLTNEHTNIAGIYELPLRTMAYETGIDKEMLPKMLKRLEPKIYYLEGWIFIRNFERHQRVRGSKKILIGIRNAKKEVPKEVMQQFTKISQEQIGYQYPQKVYAEGSNYLDIDSDTDIDLDSDLDSSKGAPKRKNFVKPTLEEITQYCKDRNNEINPEQFFNHYESKGWVVGKSSMKNWQAAVRTWESREEGKKPKVLNLSTGIIE